MGSDRRAAHIITLLKDISLVERPPSMRAATSWWPIWFGASAKRCSQPASRCVTSGRTSPSSPTKHPRGGCSGVRCFSWTPAAVVCRMSRPSRQEQLGCLRRIPQASAMALIECG